MLESSAKTKKSPTLIEFSRKVRTRRHELRLTQEQLAEKANFHEYIRKVKIINN